MRLSKRQLQDLKEKKISIEDLNDLYFINSRDKVEIESIMKLLNENICSFKELVDKFKSFKELHTLLKNTSLLKYIVDKNILSFKELVDNFKRIKDSANDPYLWKLLRNKEFFKELIEDNRLTQKDLRYLLNRIDEWNGLYALCNNTPLIKHILNEFIVDEKALTRFNTMIERTCWCKDFSIHTLFDLIEYTEYFHKNNEEILKLTELNRYAYKFDLYKFNLSRDQKLDLTEVLKDDEIAQNRLIQILENHLESNYDFESLMNYLKKAEKRNILSI